VRSQTTTNSYARVREYTSLDSTAKVYLQYQRRAAWLRQWRFTLIADDRLGLTAREIEAVINRCRHYRIILVELALDFSPASMNLAFVRRHAVFGKSRPRRPRVADGVLWYGTRRSARFVRTYYKETLNAFRVELELHSAFLRAQRIEEVGDLFQLAYVLVPKQVRFVGLDWKHLRLYLKHHLGQDLAKEVLTTCKYAGGLHKALRSLRDAGVKNAHRFLRPLDINGDVERALGTWSEHLCKSFQR
jgi:hypothetical protein